MSSKINKEGTFTIKATWKLLNRYINHSSNLQEKKKQSRNNLDNVTIFKDKMSRVFF